ncbi:Common central domain of tyrosinase [Teratosphaeria destructans]|uniref:tyrosinase n=1 Tax=Teratosphaeria destructans TaxID=418781 RepID=A0A9W7W359_9PEZI|nr:Common central domain of tyrosinase [Teratosphaeria destructans]
MQLYSFACILSLLGQFVLADPGSRPDDAAARLEKRQQNFIVTTGAKGDLVFPRLEIRQMQSQEPEMFALTVLALKKWQEMDQGDPKSYYQTAGIHGVPRQNYNGVGPCDGCQERNGYCLHSSLGFTRYHRISTAHFEQIFIEKIYEVLHSWPEEGRQAYEMAAFRTRWAFWDWAGHPPDNGPAIPKVLSDPRITVKTPTGDVTIDNPFHRHVFQSSNDLVFYPYTSWQFTMRCPSSSDPTADSQDPKCGDDFANVRASLQDQLYQMFSTCQDFQSMGSPQKSSSSPSCANSLENIHNTVHMTLGGPRDSGHTPGHMGLLAVSAFDAIFWLHHSNTDRLMALWQSQWPDSWGGSQPAPQDTWTVKAGEMLDDHYPLKPFYKDDQGNFWTGADIRDWSKTFKYTYPEFANSDGSKEAIAKYINDHYGPGASGTAASYKTKRSFLGVDVDTGRFNTDSFNITGAVNSWIETSSSLVASNGSLFQYVANMQLPRFGLDGPYNIYLFNGEPVSPSPVDWCTDANFIGVVSNLALPGSHQEILTTASIPLTRALQKIVGEGMLGSLMEDITVPWLAKNLEWKIVAYNGSIIDPSGLEGFKVSVYSTTSSQPESLEELPQWSDFVPLPEITKAKPGGADEEMYSKLWGRVE